MTPDIERIRDRATRLGYELQEFGPDSWAIVGRRPGERGYFGGTLDEIEGWLEAFEREQA